MDGISFHASKRLSGRILRARIPRDFDSRLGPWKRRLKWRIKEYTGVWLGPRTIPNFLEGLAVDGIALGVGRDSTTFVPLYNVIRVFVKQSLGKIKGSKGMFYLHENSLSIRIVAVSISRFLQALKSVIANETRHVELSGF